MEEEGNDVINVDEDEGGETVMGVLTEGEDGESKLVVAIGPAGLTGKSPGCIALIVT